jgi:hypothetical protein
VGTRGRSGDGEAEEKMEKEEEGTIQLGEKASRRARCVSMAAMDWEGTGSKMKEAWEQVLKKGAPHWSDLLQSNPILSVYLPSSSSSKLRHRHGSMPITPSAGFLHER